MKNLGHVMLDLETMGNGSFSSILSIGAVEFDINTGETGNEFYQQINLQSCLDFGLKVKAETIYWWLQQNERARFEICRIGNELPRVLLNLNNYFSELGDFQLWGNGARFDIGILEDAYSVTKINTTWNFRNERDVRTLVSFAPKIKEHYPFTGTIHNPIEDCKHQIGYCSDIWKHLNFNTNNL